METVLETAVYEITRLVEENFLQQVNRGKREAEALRRRLVSSEARLKERERFKRVRCVDCGRTTVSKRRISRGPGPQDSLDHPLVLKQENSSDSGWRCCTKESNTSSQEEPSTVLESEQNFGQVGGPKAGEMKETIEARDPQTCLITNSQIHKDPSSSSEELNGLCNADFDLRTLKDNSCVDASCAEDDEMMQRNHPELLDYKTGPLTPTSQPEPVQSSPSSRLQAGSLDLGLIKQEVVVMLPPDWEEMEKITPQQVSARNIPETAQLEVAQHGDPLTAGPHVEKQVPCPRPPVRRNSKMDLHPIEVMSDRGTIPVDRVPPICKGFLTPKLSHVRQDTDGAGGVPQVVSVKVQGDSRHHCQRTVHNCNQCGKGFSHLCHLRAHQQVHTGERQFCCTICGRSFTKLSNLKAHRRVHTGERPYICTDCGKRFTQKCNLKRHQRIHFEFSNVNK